jgi:hypothetical protein
METSSGVFFPDDIIAVVVRYIRGRALVTHFRT